MRPNKMTSSLLPGPLDQAPALAELFDERRRYFRCAAETRTCRTAAAFRLTPPCSRDDQHAGNAPADQVPAGS